MVELAMKIILFRHGEKQRIEFNEDIENLISLTNKGIGQITKLANTLKIRFPELKSLEYLFVSSYTRTVQSAEIVRSILGIKELSVHHEFKEFSPTKNYNSKKDRNLYTLAMQNHDFIPPKTGISFKKAIATFQNKLKEIYIKNKDKTILISTHSGIVRNMVYDLNPELKPSDELIGNSFIHEAGYTILNYNGRVLKLEQFDVYDYLD